MNFSSYAIANNDQFSGYHYKCNPAIVPVQISVIDQLGITMQKKLDRAGPFAEILPYYYIPDKPFFFIKKKAFPTLRTNHTTTPT